MSNASVYKWRSRFGRMDASMMTRLKEREEENRYQAKLSKENEAIADWLIRITDSQRNWDKEENPGEPGEQLTN